MKILKLNRRKNRIITALRSQINLERARYARRIDELVDKYEDSYGVQRAIHDAEIRIYRERIVELEGELNHVSGQAVALKRAATALQNEKDALKVQEEITDRFLWKILDYTEKYKEQIRDYVERKKSEESLEY